MPDSHRARRSLSYALHLSERGGRSSQSRLSRTFLVDGHGDYDGPCPGLHIASRGGRIAAPRHATSRHAGREGGDKGGEAIPVSASVAPPADISADVQLSRFEPAGLSSGADSQLSRFDGDGDGSGPELAAPAGSPQADSQLSRFGGPDEAPVSSDPCLPPSPPLPVPCATGVLPPAAVVLMTVSAESTSAAATRNATPPPLAEGTADARDSPLPSQVERVASRLVGDGGLLCETPHLPPATPSDPVGAERDCSPAVECSQDPPSSPSYTSTNSCNINIPSLTELIALIAAVEDVSTLPLPLFAIYLCGGPERRGSLQDH